MNTHLEFFSEKQQIAQVNRIREIHKEACEQYHYPGIDKPKTPFEIINRHEKMIICGDFNFTLGSIPYKIMTESMPKDISNILDAWNILYPKKIVLQHAEYMIKISGSKGLTVEIIFL
tara:strand:- start:136 stop:489 length:354 start_codon:yes stop_codon:yes gene_type:complete